MPPLEESQQQLDHTASTVTCIAYLALAPPSDAGPRLIFRSQGLELP